MKYCPACGAQLSENAAFCVECGACLSASSETKKPVINNHRSGKRNLQCPNCGSTSLSPVVESENNGGIAASGPVSRRMGITSYSSVTTHRNYWMCQDCGHKFRNLENLKEELTKKKSLLKPLLIFGILVSALLLLICIIISKNEFLTLIMLPVIIPSITCDIIIWVIWLKTRREVIDMTEERRYLERHCFSR